MSASVFDTHAYAQRLKGAGFKEVQVDAVTTGLREIATARVATKDDLNALEKSLTIKIGAISASVGALIVTAIKVF